MSKQKSILSFFKEESVVGKRLCLDSNNSALKKVKLNDGDTSNQSCSSNTQDKENEGDHGSVFTGVAKANISDSDYQYDEARALEPTVAQKKLRAKMKLLSKNFTILDPEMGMSWFVALEKEFSKPYFKKLNDFVDHEYRTYKVYPPKEKIWTWTKLCRVFEVKVVILGQDPYHNPQQAHGLSFSVPPGVKKPPSLVNIFKELQADYRSGFDKIEHGNLDGWAVQGVLLLNSVLTVRENKPNSHQDKGWEQLTTAVIKHLNDNYSGIVFLLWGAYAQKKASIVDTKKHHVLKAAHPSPLSAHKGFFGCRHFSKCNDYLKKQGKEEIEWHILPSEEIVLNFTRYSP